MHKRGRSAQLTPLSGLASLSPCPLLPVSFLIPLLLLFLLLLLFSSHFLRSPFFPLRGLFIIRKCFHLQPIWRSSMPQLCLPSPPLSPLLLPAFILYSLSLSFSALSHCFLAAVHFIICRLLLLLYLPQVQSFFAAFLCSLILLLSLSLCLSSLARPSAVVWGQFVPGSWSTGGSVLSQALNLRASNCIKSVSSDLSPALSLALPSPAALPPAHPVQFFICHPTPFVVCRSFSHS